MTGLYPYGEYDLTGLLSVWGTAGYGSGTLSVTPEAQPAIEADLTLAMAALGVRGVLIPRRAVQGFELALKTDALGVRTRSEAGVVPGGRGRLAAATGDVTRLRLALEGSWEARLDAGARLRPSFEVGLRHDGGDAETGFGLEASGGFAFAVPARGLAAEFTAHGLLTHEEGGFQDRGLTGALRYDPRPSSALGLSLSLLPSWGSAARGAEGMWSAAPATRLANPYGIDDDDPAGRLDAEVGYGVSLFHGLAVGTPWTRFRLGDGNRDYRLGYRVDAGRSTVAIEYGTSLYGLDYRVRYELAIAHGSRGAFHFGVEAARSESRAGDESRDEFRFRAMLRR